jgi:formylglycine-generating enzyme required for sulfatase activity
LPELRKARDPVWEVATIVPTDRPVHALAAVLLPMYEPNLSETDRLIETNKLAKALLQRTIKLRDVVDRALVKQPGTDRLLLIADQWEELITLCKDDASRRCFIDNILEATATTKLRVVLTLRGDYFGRSVTGYRTLSDRLQGAQVNLGPMRRDELRLAIEEPARKVGLTFEVGLVDLILEQVGEEPGHLPLLEFVLRQLWEQRRGGELHHEAYQAMGQLEGAIATKAESIYGHLSAQDQRRVQQIFLRLIRPGEGEADTRRRATSRELGEEMQSLVKTLADERLIVTSRVTGGEEDTIEVSHEALIRHWAPLKGWVEADRQFLVWQQWLNVMRKEWEAGQRSTDLLLRGLPLREAEEWLTKRAEYFSPDERLFVIASRRHKILRRSVVTAVASLGLVLVGAPGAWLWKEGVTVHYATSIVLARLHLVSVADPEMVPVSGGSYHQGDIRGLGSEDERPVRQVRIKPLAIGKYEVTFLEYDRYVELTGGRSPSDESRGREKRPVINVSWDQAVAYANWLSQATGKRYRLPTESEWEYAARSGGKDEIWAGISDEKQLADYAVLLKDRTESVGSKKPNALGLYDMSGNVYEWVEDCWHENYEGAPEDGSAWLEANYGICGRRVLRGGSWDIQPGHLRASYRHWITADYRDNYIGFRLVQDIEP